MSPSDSDLDASPNASPNASSDLAPASPDVMARILEPRVRSNAKNNPRIAKGAAPKLPAQSENTPVDPGGEVAAPQSVEDTISTATPVATLNAEKPEAGALDEVRDLLLALQESQTSRDRAFDLLYEELSGYKNDFYLERLKPTLRALLFLLDSIEEFEREVEASDTRGDALSSEAVKANLVHFRDQLTDVLTLSEMTPIEPSGDRFDPKTQRAIEVVKVEPAQNNTVQRQIRGGWKLGATMLRPADVVVGRSQ